MTSETPYRLWLKVRIGKSLATDEHALRVFLAGREVIMTSDNDSQPLSAAQWLLIQSHGFESDVEARDFGEELRGAAHMVGLCTRVGIDAGDYGEDRAVSYVNDQALRSLVDLDPDVRIAADIHGITVLPDDGKALSVRLSQAEGRALANAASFVSAFEEAFPAGDGGTAGRSALRRAVRVLNLAEMNPDPIAKVVLAISMVEGLAADLSWTDAQKEMIESAASWVDREYADKVEAEQVVLAIRRTRQASIRQRMRRLLDANGLSELWRDWDTLYSKRSRLFHGRGGDRGERDGDHVRDSDGDYTVNLPTTASQRSADT
ncbi:MAG: hypothetical protein F4W99_05385, partial [Chloroflexi bacterium]|nr:hypothetical protein [Chloroflexota bacterium]